MSGDAKVISEEMEAKIKAASDSVGGDVGVMTVPDLPDGTMPTSQKQFEQAQKPVAKPGEADLSDLTDEKSKKKQVIFRHRTMAKSLYVVKNEEERYSNDGTRTRLPNVKGRYIRFTGYSYILDKDPAGDWLKGQLEDIKFLRTHSDFGTRFYEVIDTGKAMSINDKAAVANILRQKGPEEVMRYFETQELEQYGGTSDANIDFLIQLFFELKKAI